MEGSTTREATRRLALCLAIGFAVANSGCWGEAHLEPGQAGIGYRLQGEYRSDGQGWAAQIISEGDGEFRAFLLKGGLPGEGYDNKTRPVATGRLDEQRVSFAGEWKGTLENGRLQGTDPSGKPFSLSRVVRQSPTEGAPPSAGALILFDGKPSAHLAEGAADARGLLQVPARGAEPHRDIFLHVEFRTPYMPSSGDQGKGNSGVYLQERYEVQILDSFGLPPHPQGAGAIYKTKPPRLNMSYPPLQWQTYDIEFREARFDAKGEKSQAARVTVRHNGVVIHDDVEIPGTTGRGKDEAPEPNPLLLQDHWDPVFFRNVWMLPRG